MTATISISPEQLEIVRSILARVVPQADVWVFGSRTRASSKEYSDLDLALKTPEALSIDLHAELSEAFCESDLPWKVDIVDVNRVSEAFRAVIERDKIKIQSGLRPRAHRVVHGPSD